MVAMKSTALMKIKSFLCKWWSLSVCGEPLSEGNQYSNSCRQWLQH